MSYSFVVADFETRGTVDLNKCGVDVYTEDPHFDVLCLAWAYDSHAPTVWQQGEPTAKLKSLFDHIAAGGEFVAHNAYFELTVWDVMSKRHGWPRLNPAQVNCTMARANKAALPGSLEKLCLALRLPLQKDMDGHRLMMRLSRPRSRDPLTWWNEPEKLARLAQYCIADVEAQRAVHFRLRELSREERELWTLDYHINKRGVPIDTANVRSAAEIAEAELKSLSLEMAKLTRGVVPSTTNVARLLTWLRLSEGVEVDALRKADVVKLLEKDETLSEGARAALELRKTAAKASVAKLKAMIRSTNTDGRARGLLRYHVATTGRWAGSRIQTQNLPRTPKHFKPEDAEATIGMLRHDGARAAITFEYGSTLDALSWSLRSFIAASRERTFNCADYANIEGRVAAWVAGEDWKLEAFRAYDAGTGPDLYNVAYGKSFGVRPEDVNGDQRQIGKVQELALQYQGGHGAFVSMAAGYGINPRDLVGPVFAAAEPDMWERCSAEYDEPHFNKFGMERNTWTALRVIIVGWRRAHPKINGYWYEVERAACDAIEAPGEVVSAGPHVRFRFVDGTLFCRLPSGRPLEYQRARVEWRDGLNGRRQRYVVHEGESSLSRKWEEQNPYGGLFFENIVQAVARDLLAEGIRNAERDGFPVIMHTHDEILSEIAADDPRTERELCESMCRLPSWAAGLPVTAAGWRGLRYRK